MPPPGNAPPVSPPPDSPGPTRRAARTAIWSLILVAMGLAALLLRPVRCEMCSGWTVRPRTVRLAPGWRVYCPRAALSGSRPVLCRECFRRLLEKSPAHDDAAREALGRYLTDPDALRRLGQAVERGKAQGR